MIFSIYLSICESSNRCFYFCINHRSSNQFSSC